MLLFWRLAEATRCCCSGVSPRRPDAVVLASRLGDPLLLQLFLHTNLSGSSERRPSCHIGRVSFVIAMTELDERM
jgi:hypothetical protein